MPIAATLVKEYLPEHRSLLLVTIVFTGFTAGAAGVGIHGQPGCGISVAVYYIVLHRRSV
ncbi:hypothetical protein [Neisseria iguanae]|uniref:hypothetical protein n=1 Tax=Neisseria iguanae TaxID=90242 RepID=UPI001FE7DE7D|nr:hypothetical protein [Neisseria iguanae]